MFESPLAVVAALKRYRDAFDPTTGSVIALSRGHVHDGDPFRPGFIRALEERTELARRMVARLKPRERLLLILWYVSDMQVTAIARRLQVSRVHCYRLRDKALRALCDGASAESSSRRSVPRDMGLAGG